MLSNMVDYLVDLLGLNKNQCAGDLIQVFWSWSGLWFGLAVNMEQLCFYPEYVLMVVMQMFLQQH